MNREQLLALKDGDKVVFTTPVYDDGYKDGELPPIGTVLTRKSGWMDSNDDDPEPSVAFVYTIGGVTDYHYFYSGEVEKHNE